MARFNLPLEKGNRWEYLLTVAENLGAKNLLDAVRKLFGYFDQAELPEGEDQSDYNISRVIEEVVDSRKIDGRKVYLIHSKSYNPKGQLKLVRGYAIWIEDDFYHQISLQFPAPEEGAGGKSSGKAAKRKAKSGASETDLFRSDDLKTMMDEAQKLLPLDPDAVTEWDAGAIIGEEEILLPAGWFTCKVVERKSALYGEGHKVFYCFASGIGLVQVKTPLYVLTLDKFRLHSATRNIHKPRPRF